MSCRHVWVDVAGTTNLEKVDEFFNLQQIDVTNVSLLRVICRSLRVPREVASSHSSRRPGLVFVDRPKVVRYAWFGRLKITIYGPNYLGLGPA